MRRNRAGRGRQRRPQSADAGGPPPDRRRALLETWRRARSPRGASGPLTGLNGVECHSLALCLWRTARSNHSFTLLFPLRPLAPPYARPVFNRRIRFAAVACPVVLALGASSGAAAMHSTAGRYAAAIPLRVLVPAVQDGEFKTHNKLIAQGAAVAAAEINGHAGSAPRLRIELVRVPFRADADPRTLVRRAARSHVRIVLLPCNVDTEQAWAAAAASAGDLALSPCTPEPRALARFRMAWPTAMTGNAQAGQLAWDITSHQPKGTTA